MIDIEDGMNVERPPSEWLLEKNALIGKYPGKETLFWVSGCSKVFCVHMIGGALERLRR